MKSKLMKDPLACLACNPWMTGLALHGRQGNSRGLPGYLLTYKMKHADEQLRLRRSWEAVLSEIGVGEPGATQW
ncbi:MAG: hypothetical protein ABSC65_03020 [Acidobacteriaceae bacterium]|jgi:hypothetical protein